MSIFRTWLIDAVSAAKRACSAANMKTASVAAENTPIRVPRSFPFESKDSVSGNAFEPARRAIPGLLF